MPLSEFVPSGKPILAADLPYAHEVLDGYEKVKFLDPLDAKSWAEAMRNVLEGRLQYDRYPVQQPAAPYARSWQELFRLLDV